MKTAMLPRLSKALMASYAAIGDIFFWGALRPFASIFAVILIYMGLIIAPVAFLLVYTPAHFWVRLKGFIEGYRRGKKGFEFIRSLDLPGVAVKIRWISLIILSGLAYLAVERLWILAFYKSLRRYYEINGAGSRYALLFID